MNTVYVVVTGDFLEATEFEAAFGTLEDAEEYAENMDQNACWHIAAVPFHAKEED